MNRKPRSYTGGPAVPYYRSTEVKEAAKFLRLIADRYVKGNAFDVEVKKAYEAFWIEVQKLAKD